MQLRNNNIIFKAIVPIVLFLVVFMLYLNTLNPVFHANDSPETIACAYTLGIQHPPGYPLPAMLGKIATYINVGNIGFRVNMQAAFFGALATVVLFFIMMEVFGRNQGDKLTKVFYALIVSLLFSVSSTIWSESLSAKGGIYTLNAFLLLLSILTIFKWESTSEDKYFFLFSLVFGLSMSNHWESMAVTGPAFLVFIALVLLNKQKYKTITVFKVVLSVFLFLLGILVYWYLIIRANAHAVLNWADPSTFAQLKDVFLREQYSGLEKARDFGTIAKQVKRISGLLISEFSVMGLILFVPGIIAIFKNSFTRRKAIFFSVMIATILSALSLYFNLKDEMLWIIDVFMIPVYVGMVIVIGYGVYYYSFKIQDSRFKIVVIGLFAILPIYFLFSNYTEKDQSRYYYNYDFGMNLVKSIDEGAIALLEGDFNVMPQMYFKYVDKRNKFYPVTTLFLSRDWGIRNMRHEFPEIKFQEGPKGNFTAQLNNIIAMNYKEKQIYTSVFRKAMQEFYPQGDKLFVPHGVAMKLSFDKRRTLAEAEAILKTLSYRNIYYDKLYMNNTTAFCVSNYSSAYIETGKIFGEFGDHKKAIYYLERGVQMATPPTHAQALTHLGIAYSANEQYEDSIRVYLEAIDIQHDIVEAYSNLSGVYNTLKQYDKAIEIGEKAIVIKPEFPEVYNNVGIAYYYKGDKMKAVQNLEKSVTLDPDNQMAAKNLSIIKGEMK